MFTVWGECPPPPLPRDLQAYFTVHDMKRNVTCKSIAVSFMVIRNKLYMLFAFHGPTKTRDGSSLLLFSGIPLAHQKMTAGWDCTQMDKEISVWKENNYLLYFGTLCAFWFLNPLSTITSTTQSKYLGEVLELGTLNLSIFSQQSYRLLEDKISWSLFCVCKLYGTTYTIFGKQAKMSYIFFLLACFGWMQVHGQDREFTFIFAIKFELDSIHLCDNEHWRTKCDRIGTPNLYDYDIS